MANKTLTQSYEDQNWWDLASGYVGDAALDSVGFFLPTAANNIREAIREEDFNKLDKAIANAYSQLANIYYTHREDSKIQATIDKIDGIYNFMVSSSPVHHNVHYDVIKKERQKLKDLQIRDNEARNRGEAIAEAKRNKINQDIDKMYSYKNNPDSAYTAGASINKDFASVVDKYMK